MGQKCRVCSHGDRYKMEKDYVNGSTKAQIARTYGVGYDSVRYHMEHHLPDKMIKGVEKRDKQESIDLFYRIESVLAKAERIFDRNYQGGRDHVSLKALAEIRNSLELLAKARTAVHQAQQQESDEENAPWDQGSYDRMAKHWERLSEVERRLMNKLTDSMLQDDPVIPDNPDTRLYEIIDFPLQVEEGRG